MKKIITALIAVFLLAGSYESKSQINTSLSFNTFYTQLSPYGRWVDNTDYGQVWIANANDFEPYGNNGHWVFTNYGWTWVSDYAWGWAPFHYGRWTYIQSYGWAWIPGYEWAPAWVNWCQYDDYYGWAPMGPGMGFNMGFGAIPFNHWRFVRHQYINSPNVYQHYQRPAIKSSAYNQVTIINNTQVNNNITYATGPAQQEVERITRKKIQLTQVNFTEEPSGKAAVVANEIRLYRPGTETGPAGVNRQPVKQATEPGTAIQPSNPALVKPPTTRPISKQPGELKNEGPAGVPRDQQLQPVKQQPQQITRKEEELLKPVQPAEQHNQQQADLNKQQEVIRQQQIKEQEAAARQQVQQQQDVQRKQREQQAEARRQQQQNDIRQQQIRQEQLRQQRQDEIRQQKPQRQPVRKELAEERAAQQPAAPVKAPAAKPSRKD